jgi:prephenate dehydrogenase
LIGGSIAKALRRVHPEYRLIAYNRSKSSLIAAMSDGTINQATDVIDASFSECDFIFLCMPVSVNIQCLKQLQSLVPKRCVITDVGSVKSTIHEAVRELGMEDRFIGGHPMAGSEKTGYASATDRMLENAYYIITPTSVSNPDKVEEYRQLVADTGALPVIIRPDEHDYATAAISHLPHVIAYTLVNLVRTSDNPDGLMRQLAAGGFKDITRIASSSPDMWESICLENSQQLLTIIEAYSRSLSEVASAIAQKNGPYLHDFFEEAKDYRDSMPMKLNGSIVPVYEIYVDIIDESGAIATIATILASNNINIKNISILHNREFQEGVLRIEFYQADAVARATAILSKFAYNIHQR